ncbi:ClpX C4-type zinc finger protein [Arthrobacter sp. AL12]|uniref:ClpX C4-type zinc finger protein n=1 Tax=Arthrobacter sp. AL12 TaxID=3042241 RepID=UPI00249B8FB2|nr:ClpX C4-type zinc finger protein [Arthrobacter sp. AL12]MDI3211289.1 ClpX C4-type zinc finger protein [Arthrobacter sp. AL12]
MDTDLPLAGPMMCSFCAKSASSMRRLVAGPGVAICGDCARSSIRLLSGTDSSPEEAPWAGMTDEALLAHLPEISAVAAQVEDRLCAWVETARQRSISWARIGAALGMTRQSAWERFRSPAADASSSDTP